MPSDNAQSIHKYTEAELALMDYRLRRLWEEYNLAIASGGGTPTPTRGATAPATPTEYDSGESSLDMWVNAWGTGDINADAEYINEQCDSHDWREWPLDITRKYCKVCGIDEGVED